MKYINKLIVVLLAILAMACNRDEENKPSWSDVSWYTEAGGWAHQNLARQVGQSMSFMDLSQGVYSHQWLIDSGNYFIAGEFQKGDDLTDFIIPGSTNTSEDYNINVLFTVEGKQGVRLYNKFYNPVKYIGYNGDADHADTLESYLGDDGMWVIDTTLVVDVYGEIYAEAELEVDGQVIATINQDSMIYIQNGETKVLRDIDDKDQWPTLTIDLEQKFIYRDITSKGRTDTRTWVFPPNAEIVAFNNEGISYLEAENAIEVEMRFNDFVQKESAGNMTAERTYDVVADKQKIDLPFRFNVAPPELKAAYKVYHRGVEVLSIGEDDEPSEDESTWTTLDIALDDELVFEDLTNEVVEIKRAWEFVSGERSGESGTEKTDTNKYTTQGNGLKVGSFTVTRTINKEEQTDTKVIPLKLNVTLSQEGDTEILGDVFTMDEITNTVSFFSNEILQDIPASSASDFTISGTDYLGNPLTLNITAVALNPDDHKQVMITLDADTYNSDFLHLSYNGTAIISRAGIALNPFDLDVVNTNNAAQQLDDRFRSFEEYKGKENGGKAMGWFSSHDAQSDRYFYYNRVDENASDGGFSLKFHLEDDISTINRLKKVETITSEDFFISYTESTYEISFDIYVVEGQITSPLTDNFEINMVSSTQNTVSTIDFNSIEKGKWVKVVIRDTYYDTTDKTKLQFQFKETTSSAGPVTFFIDNTSMKEIKVRP
ncbi:hypothetical protein [Flammeovirga pacifica]|uniref:Uncharacterized protein n=1 Tax=Flammeovirga pacifica TaxID=915059 RepID=A0A1S1YU84_FLAPC|nr:hypothetical protein [Flammeovirga pacifica]OHX64433.1 hypothetical protein NH26_22870 [Flammeovirga pacifica]